MLALAYAHPAVHATAYHIAKRVALIGMTHKVNDGNAFTSIKRVCKMIPESIGAVLGVDDNDSWWCVRDVITPIIFTVAPIAWLAVGLYSLFSVYIQADIGVVLVFSYVCLVGLCAVLGEFSDRYYAWASEERKKHRA